MFGWIFLLVWARNVSSSARQQNSNPHKVAHLSGWRVLVLQSRHIFPTSITMAGSHGMNKVKELENIDGRGVIYEHTK